MGLNPHAAARLRAKKRPSSSSSTSSKKRPSSSSQPKPLPAFKEKRAADLEWKKLTLPAELGFDDDGGLLELDELDGVEVTYENGKVVFKVRTTLLQLLDKRALTRRG
jgi:ATP-dependent RNA helicase DDX24/MAK5